MTERPEIEALERMAAWRLRLVDADPADAASAAAARVLEALAEDLRNHDHPELWRELAAMAHWLGEADAMSDFADLASDYRARIGLSAHPENGAAYIRALQDIARSLI